jgi:signal peptidase
MKKLTKAWNVFTTALVILVVVVAVGLVGVRLLGFKPLYVMSGSMKPAFPVGSLIFVQKTAPENIKVGDPITYTINDEGDYSTHRVIAIESYETSVRTLNDDAGQPLLDENGEVQYEEYALDETCYHFQTKGDANELPDGTPVYYKNVVGVPRLTIPYLGYFAQWLQTPKGRILGISVALVIVILTFLPDLLKWVDEGDKKKETVNQEEEVSEDAEDGE